MTLGGGLTLCCRATSPHQFACHRPGENYVTTEHSHGDSPKDDLPDIG